MRLALLLTASSLVALQTAVAQTPEDGDEDIIVVTGLRPTPVDTLTAAVTVLDPSDLAVRDAPFIVDALRAVPGLGVSRSGAAGGLTQVRMRGAEANHTLVLIDGIEVSDPTTGETDFGLFSGVQPARVEVLRGEQSGLYGSDAIGGVINIVTGRTDGLTGRIEAGSRQTMRLEGQYGAAADAGSINVIVGGLTTEGVNTANEGDEEDGTLSGNAIVTGAYEADSGLKLTGLIRYGYTETESDPDSDFDGALNDALVEAETDQWTVGATASGDAFGMNHRLQLSYNQVSRDNLNAGVSTNTSEGQRTQVIYTPSNSTALENGTLRVTGLVAYEREDYEARDTQFGGFTNQDEDFTTWGFGAEAVANLGRVDLSASVRHDDNDGFFEDATTGRVGIGVAVAERSRLRASIGTGVKNPTFTELFGFFPGSFIGNPDLEPEQSVGWEVGIDQNVGLFALSATYFEATLEDEIFTAFTPTFQSTPQNRDGESDRSGIELGAQWVPTEALLVSGQFTSLDSTADDGSAEIRVPQNTASVAINYAPMRWAGSRYGVAFDYVGEQDDFDFGTFPSRRVTLDSYVLTSATAEFPVHERWAVTLRGENIFNEDVVDVLGFNTVGAGVFVGLTLR